MKGTENFKSIIQNHLQEVAKKDPLFAKNLGKENKSIDECINYIFSEVQKLKKFAFADDEIFNMAIHYYDEDDIKSVKKNSIPKVVHTSPGYQPKDEVKKEPKLEPKENVLRVVRESRKLQIDNNQVSIFDFEGV